MAIVISGTAGTISGISTGGLPDGCVDADTLATTLDLSGNTITLPSGTGGKVLQVVTATTTTAVSSSSSSFVTINLSASITPASTSSKILIFGNCHGGRLDADEGVDYTIYRGGTNLGGGTSSCLWNEYKNTAGDNDFSASFNYLDSPSTTSSTTYYIYGKSVQGATINLLRDRGISSITLMEIAG